MDDRRCIRVLLVHTVFNCRDQLVCSPAMIRQQIKTLLTAKEVARRFKGAKGATVAELLETLVSLGQARRDGERYRG